MKNYYLGIDIGSVAIGIAVIDDDNLILHSSYSFHKGQIKENLIEALKGIEINKIKSVGYTSSGPAIFSHGVQVDSKIAFISAAKYFHPEMEALLIVGAEKFGLATFSKTGEYLNFKSNTSCAAGTGNFLDQQAERLNLKDIGEFSRIAWENTGSYPKIASRCAVFAKTDLIHAQQEGYSVGEICDGLCYGLAKNIVDTVFHNNKFAYVFADGGVALNKRVIYHIEKLLDQKIGVGQYANIYGAIGAAINCKDEANLMHHELKHIDEIIRQQVQVKNYYYPPLQLELSDYPDFSLHHRYFYTSICIPKMKEVEIDVYATFNPESQVKVYLGIDIGSTSTKAVMIDKSKEVLAGFYTYTLGQPLQAVQTIFEAIDDFAHKHHITIEVSGSATTGSGRKFMGRIIGADIIADEITAHARAAFELNPQVDTIIEIGGQDSKFTVMRNGMVTFSVMNNVCAAGTGSFIEEQAKRLGCKLDEYSSRVENIRAPMASDRCTVFMERDLNHYLMAGYTSDEILASVLHSTRENYFMKVAVASYIGKTILFQGATAKNKALIAAFEQKLKKPIIVSRYCHLTGALGVALELHDKQIDSTKFKGIGLYKKSIAVKSEVCELCTNHCKLKVAEVDNQIEAYGFLCGRDYNVNKYVKNKSVNFQLIRKREELFRFKAQTVQPTCSIGIPAALYLYDELLFWRKFFDLLSIKTVTSEDYTTAVKDGKNLSRAEFCSPITAMHGHVGYLMKKADYIFLPVYLEESRDTKTKKQYCYYSQFISSVIQAQKNFDGDKKLLTPILNYTQGALHIRLELHRMLKSIGIKGLSLINLSMAYEQAKEHVRHARDRWKGLYSEAIKESHDIHIMLLGRPYTVLSPSMNNSIPDIIEKMGVKTFFMDMMRDNHSEISKSDDPFKAIQWKFASKILHAADIVAKTDNCYPVLITSFKCAPDSFAIEYFKEILDAAKKPYLILQLDEHDSAVGYETRIEAAIRSFRNHREKVMGGKGTSVNEKDPEEIMRQPELTAETKKI